MKAFTAVLLLLAAPIMAQEQAPARSISVQCKETGSQKVIDRKWESGYGSYDRDYSRSKNLETEIRNSSKLPATVVVTIYWIVKDRSNNQVGIQCRESAIATIAGGRTHKIDFLSPLITENDLKLVALGQRYREGLKSEGYVITVTRDGESIAMTGTQKIQTLARSSDFPAMIAAFDKADKKTTQGKGFVSEEIE